jgi:hypothetical protein
MHTYSSDPSFPHVLIVFALSPRTHLLKPRFTRLLRPLLRIFQQLKTYFRPGNHSAMGPQPQNSTAARITRLDEGESTASDLEFRSALRQSTDQNVSSVNASLGSEHDGEPFQLTELGSGIQVVVLSTPSSASRAVSDDHPNSASLLQYCSELEEPTQENIDSISEVWVVIL